MKRIIYLIIIAQLLALKIYAQIQYQVLQEKYVGPGIVYKDILAPSVPWTIDVLEIDLENPFVKIETVKANDRITGNETTGSMASRKSREGHIVVGAINADFYGGGGVPIGSQVLNGEIMKINSNFSTIGFSPENAPFLDFANYEGKIFVEDTSITISGINKSRDTDQIILYNSYMGETTGTNQWGSEMLVQPIDPWIVNDTIRCIVVDKEDFVGNMNIPLGQAVLSSHGAAKNFTDAFVAEGDTIKILNSITTMPDRIAELIGGYPKIVKNGVDYVDEGYQEEGGPPHTYERHPRTAVGFSSDSSKAYFITVDGRGYSKGMTLHELAEFMISIGVHYGLNLDGGGSTTMIVRNQVMNVPSDGSQRAVANAMLVVSTAPVTDSLAYIDLSPDFIRIFKGESYTFSVIGQDKYFNPVSLNQGDVQFSIDSNIGTINENGVFVAANRKDSGYVYVEANGLRDSSKVIVKSIGKLILSPVYIVVDTTAAYQFRVYAYDEDGVQKQLDYSEFNWWVRNPEIAVVDAEGLLKGLSEGETYLYVGYENVADSVLVKVEVVEGVSILHTFDTTDNLTLSGENLNLANCSLSVVNDPVSEGSGSLKIVYEYTGSSSQINYVYLNTDISFEGTPDTIALDAMTNGRNHQFIYFFHSDFSGNDFQVNVKKWANSAERLDIQPGAFSDIVSSPPGSIFNFPVKLKQIRIKLGDPRQEGVVYRDSIFVDNFRIWYPGTVTDVNNEPVYVSGYSLEQNYPNPFNPTTTIKFSIPSAGDAFNASRKNIILRVFDILGREVQTLVNEQMSPGTYEVQFDGSSLASGVYFYQLKADGFIQTKKLVLLR